MNAFEIKNVSYQVEDLVILKDINLTITEGSFVALSGPSGSGKSTLLKMLASMVSPTEGQINYRGLNLASLNPSTYRKEVSYFFQSAVLFGETVEDNLKFPYQIRGEQFDAQKANEYLKHVGLEGFMTKRVKELSGGEKQRVALIRNVLFSPKVLLLDEITTGLDRINRDIIWNWLKSLRENSDSTIVMVSHNEEDIALADYTVEIVGGELQ